MLGHSPPSYMMLSDVKYRFGYSHLVYKNSSVLSRKAEGIWIYPFSECLNRLRDRREQGFKTRTPNFQFGGSHSGGV